ncbi:transporter [uncultured Amphritea sp.]|uniref:transporter n=1 Tax=uncultured Amphritea sp. TaxID=981605 RepID=UPI00261A7503|nr:transporter [uncultured Amphritea sp.]
MKSNKIFDHKTSLMSKINTGVYGVALKITLTASVLTSVPSYAIDIDAGDWETAPAGTNVAILYAQHVKRDKLYENGNVVADNAKLTSDVSILRYVHWTSLGGHPFALEALLPMGRLETEGALSSLGNASGVGDAILLAPIWLVDNKAKRNSFAVVPYVFVPTGSYNKDKPLNLGENRFKYDLQLGYTHGIGDAFNIELAGDVMFFGKNHDTSLSQDPLYQVQGHLSYQLDPTIRLAAGLSHTFGGETSIKGVDQDDEVKTTKSILTFSKFIGQRNQILFSYGKDLSVENGLKEGSRFNFRLLHVF